MSDLFFAGSAFWFSVPALIGTGFFLLRTALMFVGGVDDGIGADVDVDVDLDVDVDVDFDHGDSSAAFRVLSIQAIAAFLMGFGWGGLTAVRGWGLPALIGVLVGIATGSAMVWLLAKLLAWIYSMQSSGSMPIAAALLEEATVYISIPAARQGKGSVRVVVGDRQRYYHAVTDSDAIDSRSRVLVTDINEDNSVTVERLPSQLPPSGV